LAVFYRDAARLVELEIELARQELKEMLRSNAWAAGLLTAAGLFGLLGLLVALPVLVVELVPWHWQAALVWLALYLVLAGGLGWLGRSLLRLEPPPRTLRSLKETRDWLQHLSSNSR